MTDVQLMRHIARVAHDRYKLTVWQWLPGEVHGHSSGSYHYQTYPGHRTGRAFDAYGTGFLARRREARFSRWLRRTHKSRITEGIHNGRWTNLSIKNGRNVDPSTWGSATWAGHKTHVHVAI